MKWSAWKQIQDHAQQVICIHRQRVTADTCSSPRLTQDSGGRTRWVHCNDKNIVFGPDWCDQPPDEKPFVLLCQCVELVDDVIKFAEVGGVLQLVHGNAFNSDLSDNAKGSKADSRGVQKVRIRLCDRQQIACTSDKLHPNDR